MSATNFPSVRQVEESIARCMNAPSTSMPALPTHGGTHDSISAAQTSSGTATADGRKADYREKWGSRLLFDDLTEENQKLERQNKDYARANQELRKLVGQLLAERNQAQAAIASLQQIGGNCIEVAKRLKTQDQELKLLRAECANNDAVNKSLEDCNLELCEANQQLKQQLVTREVEVEMLQTTNARIASSAFGMNVTFAQMQSSSEAVNMRAVHLQGRVADLERERKSNHIRLRAVEAVASQAFARNKILKVQLQELSDEQAARKDSCGGSFSVVSHPQDGDSSDEFTLVDGDEGDSGNEYCDAASSAEALALQRRALEASATYGRGTPIRTRSVKDKKLRSNLRALEAKYRDASLKAKDAEILNEHDSGFIQPEGELERTYKVRQDDIREAVGVETAKKGFELRLEGLGPYVADYTRNGRELLLAGRKGHVATMDWRDGKLGCELHLGETVRDAKWLHNNQYFAVAQKKSVYIYGRDGVELHNLQKHVEVRHMEFLPYFYLLATVGNAGYLKYTDTSTGATVAETPTHLGQPTSMTQNPYNSIINIGHQNGTVTLWSPNTTEPLVKILAHRGPVRAMGIDREGRYMVSAGADSRMAVWDLRMYKAVHNYFLRRPGSSVAISDRGLAAVGWGTQVSVWRGLFDKAAADQEKVQAPYMAWGGEGRAIERVRWCPLEDVLGVSHDQGFSSLLVPGAGEPNYDALEVNPYETVKQRQETEVRTLLHKLQPEMISLDPNFIGNIDLASHETRMRERDLDRKPEDIVEKLKNRGRGKNSALRKHLRKRGQKNVVDETRVRLEAARKAQNSRDMTSLKRQREEYGPALARFARKAP
ncbi:putative U3 small nucleolar RNA-associated protein 7 [Coniosporium tulheliwenetii]|uniref:U3 small nucleolar RNA-associated protein 7 n=1 Tax=Coniosporium tulheliwenetii TaxID=3383036 RepID=A0ACC2ZDN1_9PEZI|nr:putative U3 small nucleolar RNA-associated protein 7 [Cladosporium sp. JES 115]